MPTEIHATPQRIRLMLEIDDAMVRYEPDEHRFILDWQSNPASQRVVTARFNELRRAGLARLVGTTDTELTDAGHRWLDEQLHSLPELTHTADANAA